MCCFSQSKWHVLPTQTKLPAGKRIFFSMPWVLGLAYFSHAWWIYFFFSSSKVYDNDQDQTMEIVATCRQNMEKEIVRTISYLELVVWQAFPMSPFFDSRRLLWKASYCSRIAFIALLFILGKSSKQRNANSVFIVIWLRKWWTLEPFCLTILTELDLNI